MIYLYIIIKTTKTIDIMEAKMSIEQFRIENAANYAIIKLTFVKVDGEVAKLATELGFKKMAFNSFWMRVNNNEEFAKYRNPFIDMIKNGTIVKA